MSKLGTLYRKYLRGSDLEKPCLVEVLTVQQVQVTPVPGHDAVVKWCIFVKGVRDFPDDVPNGILFGPKLEEALVALFGKIDTDQLTGKQIVLYPQQLKVGREMKTAIRIRAPKNGAPDPEPPDVPPDLAIESLLD